MDLTPDPQQVVVTAAAALTVPGFFGWPYREAFIVAGFAPLVWVPPLPSRPALNRAAAVLEGSSLWISLTHWQVMSIVGRWSRTAALAASLAFGIACAVLAAGPAADAVHCSGKVQSTDGSGAPPAWAMAQLTRQLA